MIRNDFVSNSSSTSFMIAVEKDNIKSFINDFCKKTEDKKSEYHIKDLVNNNKNILNYVYDNIRMLYFGGVLVNTTTRKFSKDDKDDKQYYYYKNMLKNKDLLKSIESFKVTDNKNSVTVTFHEFLWNLTLPKQNYTYSALNLSREDKNKDKFEMEFDSLLDYIKSPQYYNRYNSSMLEFKTSIINMNTLLNTKFLIKCGYKLSTDCWDIDKLSDMLSDDKSIIFKIEVGYEGDGTGYDCLYTENEKFFDNLMFDIPGIILDKNRYGLKEKHK